MKTMAFTLIFLALTACTAMHGTVLPNSPGERAAIYSVELRIHQQGADALLVGGTLKPAAALQLADAMLTANASLRLYYDMSDCKAAQSIAGTLLKEGATKDPINQALAQTVATACAQFNGQPFDQVAQLELAKSALTVLSQTLHSAGSK